MSKPVNLVIRKYTILHVISQLMKITDATEAQKVDSMLSTGLTLSVDQSYNRKFTIKLVKHLCLIKPDLANIDRPGPPSPFSHPLTFA